MDYNQHLCNPCDPEEIVRLSKVVFVEGHLDRIDDLLVAILPLANIIYYRHVKFYDDREYAKEDLISGAVLRLYQDMTLRWDKYIHIDSYYDYYSRVLRNGMIGDVHGYHNFYIVDDIDPERTKYDGSLDDAFDKVEMDILKESIKSDTIELASRILKYRKVNTNLLLSILKNKYIEKRGVDSLRSRVRVLGVPTSLFDFYCEHVNYVYRLSYNYQYAVLGGKTKMVSRLSSILGRYEDITYRTLSINYYDSIIPEIYAEFGSDIAKRFVRVFSGRTVQVPNYRDFCDDLLSGVVVTLADGDRANLYRVSEEHHIPYKLLARIYNKAVKSDSE